jgi:hypothetical protein
MDDIGTQTNNVFKYSLPKIKCSFFKTSFKLRVNKLPLETFKKNCVEERKQRRGKQTFVFFRMLRDFV